MIANNLKTRAVISTSLLLIIYFCGAVGIEYFYIKKADRQHQEQSVRNAVNIAEDVLREELAHLKEIAHDYAHWDDTYQFMRNRRSEYLENNFHNNILFDDTQVIFMWNHSKEHLLADLNIETKGFYLPLLNLLPEQPTISSGFIYYHGSMHIYTMLDVRSSSGKTDISPGYLMLVRPINIDNIHRLFDQLSLNINGGPKGNFDDIWFPESLSDRIDFTDNEAKVFLNEEFWFDINMEISESNSSGFSTVVLKEAAFLIILLSLNIYILQTKVFASLNRLVHWVKSIDLDNHASFKTDVMGDSEVLKIQDKVGSILQYQVEKEKQHTDILKSMTDYVVIIDGNGVIQYVNHSASEWINQPSETLCGMNLDYWIAIEDQQVSIFPWLNRCFKDGETQTAIFNAIKYHGNQHERVQLQVTFTPIVTGNATHCEQVMLIARAAANIDVASVDAIPPSSPATSSI